MAVGQVAQAASQRPAGCAGTQNKSPSCGRQEGLEKTKSQNMIDMGVAQKNIRRGRGRCAVAQFLAERNDSRAGIEDQPSTIDFDFDAGSVAADSESIRGDCGIAAANAPKFNPEMLSILGVARRFRAHRVFVISFQ